MIAGLGVFAFLLSFLTVLLAQQVLSRSVRGLLAASAVQTGGTLLAVWALLRHSGEPALRAGEASGIAMIIAMVIPALGLALVLNSAIGFWHLRRIWREKRG